MAFEQIPQPFMRPKAKEEKKENKFDQPVDMISGRFFDDFIRENVNMIRIGNLGILEQNLAAGVNKLIGEAVQNKGEDFATQLEKYILDDLNNYRYLIPHPEQDSLVKRQAEKDLIKDLEEKGIVVEIEEAA